jgi:hypothetical protein
MSLFLQTGLEQSAHATHAVPDPPSPHLPCRHFARQRSTATARLRRLPTLLADRTPHLPPRGAVLNRTPTPTHAAAALQKAPSAAVAQFFLPCASFFIASSPPRPFPLLEFSYLSSTTRDPAIASESHSEVAAAIAGEGLSSCCSSPIHGWLASSSPHPSCRSTRKPPIFPRSTPELVTTVKCHRRHCPPCRRQRATVSPRHLTLPDTFP